MMVEKAQEVKRKWNLDDKTGKITKNSKISKPLLISVAKDIGLDFLDGNPYYVETMVELECSRTAASKLNCSLQGCNNTISLGQTDKTEITSSSTISQSPVNNCQDGNPDIQKTDQEMGWSKVENRKKDKKKGK